MKIDLHCHSYHSDGLLTPQELLARAHNMQVDVLALTDHDTVAGIQPLIEEQQKYKRSLEIISGVEISTSWHSFDIHIIGLKVDHHNQTFLQRLQQQTQRREIRAQKIDSKLAKAGVHGILEVAKELAGVGQITRAHFARAMVKQQVVSDNEAAFKKYLGKGKKAHVKPEWITMQEAIAWIHDAGGRAVLAHPGHYDMTSKWLRRLVAEFSQAGGDGIEANHPHLAPAKRAIIEELSIEHGLLASSGSDFHFPSRWTELGKNLKMSDKLTPVWHDWQPITN
ncbi:PHP domain-containing protein [Aliiglaciecola litoralis]